MTTTRTQEDALAKALERAAEVLDEAWADPDSILVKGLDFTADRAVFDEMARITTDIKAQSAQHPTARTRRGDTAMATGRTTITVNGYRAVVDEQGRLGELQWLKLSDATVQGIADYIGYLTAISSIVEARA